LLSMAVLFTPTYRLRGSQPDLPQEPAHHTPAKSHRKVAFLCVVTPG